MPSPTAINIEGKKIGYGRITFGRLLLSAVVHPSSRAVGLSDGRATGRIAHYRRRWRATRSKARWEALDV